MCNCHHHAGLSVCLSGSYANVMLGLLIDHPTTSLLL